MTIDSSAGAVNGQTSGIRAVNRGSGALALTTAKVTGANAWGIYSTNFGTDLIIESSAGTVSGNSNGISADNKGSGALSITSASVTGTTKHGLQAKNSGTALTVDSSGGSVIGGYSGIYANNNGSGATSVTAANVTGTSRRGIEVWSLGSSLTINSAAGTVSGDDLGLLATNYGSGASSVTTADVIGLGSRGLEVFNASGTDLTIHSAAGTVSGNGFGVFTQNNGSGALSVTTANVTGTNQMGIRAVNYGTHLTINSAAGKVGSRSAGISALNYGSGASSVTTADVTSAISIGIEANNRYGAGLTINSVAGTVSGNSIGIRAYNIGSDALSLKTAAVMGTRAGGILANNYGTELTIDSSAGIVQGADFGINATNWGSDALDITTADVTSTTGRGIIAFNVGAGLTIDSSTGTVSGHENGIYALNFGSGALEITTANVTATNGDGIGTVSITGADITVVDTGTVTGTNHSINTVTASGVGADDSVKLHGALNGNVALNSGDDSFNLYSTGNIASVARLDGGSNGAAGDAFSLVSFASTLDLSSVVNFETFSVSGGAATLGGTAAFEDINFNSGVTTLANGANLTATNGAAVLAGATLKVGAGATSTLTGNLDQAGTLILANDGTLVVTGDATLKSGSTTTFGLEIGANGVLASGSLTLDAGSQTDVDVTNATRLVPGARFVIGSGTSVTNNAGVAVTDNSFLFDFAQSVSGGQLILTALQYHTDCNFASDPNQVALCNIAINLFGSDDTTAIVNGLASLSSGADVLAAIEALSPGDGFSGNLLSFSFGDGFMNSVSNWLNRSGSASPASLTLVGRFEQTLTDPNADWQLWTNAAYSFGFQDAFTSDGNRINDIDSNSTLYVMGLDRFLDDGDLTQGPARIGLAASYGYGWAEETLAAGAPKQIEQHSFGALGYAEAKYRDFKLSGRLGYSFHWNDHRRSIQFLGQTAKAEYGTHQLFAQTSVEPASAYRYGEWDFSPRLTYSFQHLNREGYTETGSAANLVVSGAQAVRHEAKARFTFGRDWSKKARGEAFVEYGHNFGTNAATTARLAAGGRAFGVQGVNADDDWFTLGSSFAVEFKDNAQVGLSHESTLAENSHSHDISAWIRYQF